MLLWVSYFLWIWTVSYEALNVRPPLDMEIFHEFLCFSMTKLSSDLKEAS
jgi:hypothetical protein